MITTLLLVLAQAVAAQNGAQAIAATPAASPLAHVSNSFHFVVHAPMARMAPLFGAEGE